jgi:hypothetical protein
MPQKRTLAWIDTEDDNHVGESFQFDELFVTVAMKNHLRVIRQISA